MEALKQKLDRLRRPMYCLPLQIHPFNRIQIQDIAIYRRAYSIAMYCNRLNRDLCITMRIVPQVRPTRGSDDEA